MPPGSSSSECAESSCRSCVASLSSSVQRPRRCVVEQDGIDDSLPSGWTGAIRLKDGSYRPDRSISLAHPKQLLLVGPPRGAPGISVGSGGAQNLVSRPVLQAAAVTEWQQMEDIEHGLSANFEGSLAGLGVDLSASAFNMSEAIMSLSPFKFMPADAGGDSQSGPSSFVSQEQLPTLSGGGSKFQFALSASTSPAIKLNEEPLTYLNQGHPYEVKMSFYNQGEKSCLLRSVFRISFHERRMQFMEKEHLEYWKQSRPGERILDIDIPLSYNLRDVTVSPGCINAAEVLWESGCDCGVFVKLHCISTEFTARKHGGEKGIPFRLQIDTFDPASGDHVCSVAAQVKVFKPKGADRKHKTDREKVERRTEAERNKYQPSLPYTPFRPAPYAPVGAASPSSVASGAGDSAAGDAASGSNGSVGGGAKVNGCGAKSGAVQLPMLVARASSTPAAAAASGIGEERDSADVSVIKQESGGASRLVRHHQHHYQQQQQPPQQASGASSGASSGSPRSAHSPLMMLAAGEAAGSPPLACCCEPSDHHRLSPTASPQRVADWLERHRFPPGLTRALHNFSGTDLLRLTRSDLVEICGPAEGVRLANCLTQRPCRARLLFYVGQENESVFHPVYLNQLTHAELFAKVAGLFQADSDKISQILFYGPGGIPVCISDEMVGQLENETRFSLHVVPDVLRSGRFRIFMKPQAADSEATASS